MKKVVYSPKNTAEEIPDIEMEIAYIKDFFYSFISVISMVIDEQTPYNANHTMNLVRNLEKVMTYINAKYEKREISRFITETDYEQIAVSGWLHDIGKLAIPQEVMNKATRLEGKLETILDRLEYIRSLKKIDYLEKRLSKQALEVSYEEIRCVEQHVMSCNEQRVLSPEECKYTQKIGTYTFIDLKGNVRKWLEDEEIENLSIKSGTLNTNERKMMEQHVVYTQKLLSNMNFEKVFKDVPYLAQSHHEYLDGTGYPNKLTAKDLSFGARLLAVMDKYEALSSSDRPYKPKLTVTEIFEILNQSVEANKIDGEIVGILKEMNDRGIL